MDPDDGIVFECAPFIRVYQSGRVERCPEATATTPPGLDPATGVSSKDVPISLETGVRARLYLPADGPAGKLPVLVYYHGGGFCLDSAFSPTYHNYINSLAARAGALVVPVDYRLAPEHPIPAAYDDGWVALRWVAAHAGGPAREEPWLADRGDFGRLFVAGDSAGANLAHNVAMRARDAGGSSELRGVRIAGVALVHPYFLGAAHVESEAMNPALAQTLVKMWRMVCGSTIADVDDPRINPLAAGAPSLGKLACMRVLVCSGEKEVLKDRAKAYCRILREEGGGDVEFYEAIGEDHDFHIADPKCEGALAQDMVIRSFINQGK